MSTTSRNRITDWRHQLGLDSEPDRRAAVVLVSSIILVIVAWHWGRPHAFRDSGLETWVVDLLGSPGEEYAGTLPYLFWGVASVLFRMLIPLGLIVFVLRSRPGDFGYRVRGIAPHLPWYGLLYVLVLPLLLLAVTRDSFQATYPFYRGAAEGGLQFWLYEAGYLLQFVALEAFFRGYMVFGLRPRFGPGNAVLIMTIPYVMIHFGKPTPEVFAAVGAGIILGHLALRTRSWVPGVFLHIAVALTMDILAIGKITGGIGEAFRTVF